MPRRRAPGQEAGAAVVDFVLVLMVLLPLFLGVVQLALVLHVRNTATAAAAEGARLAAVQGAGPDAGIARASDQFSAVVSARFLRDVRLRTVQVEGMPAYRLVMDVRVPALGMGGPAVEFTVSGSAVLEPAVPVASGGGP